MLAIVKVKNSEITATYFVYRLVYTYNIYLYACLRNTNKICISIHVQFHSSGTCASVYESESSQIFFIREFLRVIVIQINL